MNFCPNCGAKLGKIGKFCTQCGHALQGESDEVEKPIEESTASSDQKQQPKDGAGSQNQESKTLETNASKEQAPQSKKPDASRDEASQTNQTAASVEVQEKVKKGIPKKWLTLAIVLAVVIGGSAATAFIFMKSPKALYFLAEYNSYKQLKADYNEVYGSAVEYEKMLLEKPSSNELKMTGNFEFPQEIMTPEIAMAQEVLSKVAINVKSQQDINKNIAKVNLGLEMDGAETIAIDIFQSPEVIGAQVPVLYDKSFYLHTNQFGQFMRSVYPYYQGPEMLDLNSVKWTDLQLTEEEMGALTKNYGEFLVTQLKEESFTMEKGVSFEHNGESMKLRKITLKLSPEETEAFLKAWIDRLLADDELQSMIAKRVVLVNKSAMLDQEDATLSDPEKIKEELKTGLQDMKGALDEISFPDGMESVVLIDKKEQIVDRTIQFSIDFGYDVVDFEISSKNAPYEDSNRYQEIKFKVGAEEEGTVEFLVSNDIHYEKENRMEDLKVSLTSDFPNEYAEPFPTAAFTMHSDYKEYKDGKVEVAREFEVTSPELGEVDISGTIDQKGQTDIGKLTSNHKVDLVLTIVDQNQSGKIMLGLDSTSSIDEKLKIDPIDTKNGLNIAEITEEDLYSMQEEIGLRIMELMAELGMDESMFYGNDYSGGYGDTGYEDYGSQDMGYDEYYSSNDAGVEEASFTDYVAADPEGLFAQSCAACHGQNLEGGVGPSLATVGSRLDAAQIEEVILNGRGAMPAGLLQGEDAAVIAAWLAEHY